MSGISLLAALKAFDATAHWGSMTAAARALSLQQPTVSAHIQRLEQQYGVELLYRRGRRLELTTFGRALLEHTRRAFSAEENAHALLAAARICYAGRLMVHAIGPYNVVPILKAFEQAHPQVSVAIGVGDSKTITEKIIDYQGDVGVVLDHVEVPELYGMSYRTQRLVVFAHCDHPLAQRGAISLQELHGQRFVMREQGSTTRRVLEQALADRGVQIHAALEMGSREAVREAVAHGLGLGVVSQTAYVSDPRLVRLSLRDSAMATQVYLICRSERRQSPLIAAFFDVAGRLRGDLE